MRVRLPLTPVTVNVNVPAGVLLNVDTVSVDAPVVGLGEKLPLPPAGRPEMLSVTFPLNPPVGVSVTV